VVYVGSEDHYLYAIDATTGSQKWAFKTNDAVESSPAVSGDLVIVYVGSFDSNVYAIDAKYGTQMWSFQAPHISSSPTVADGAVYIGGYDNHNVSAINTADGSPKWAEPFTTGSQIASSPAVVNGVVYIGSDDGSVYAINAEDGSPKWTNQTADLVRSSPAVADGVVYIGSDDGYVYAFDAVTGIQKWTYQTGNSVRSSPAVVNGVVYVGSNDDKVYVIGGVITPTISWSNPADITYGTHLSSTQLNAIAIDPRTSNTVPGTYAYNPPAETVLDIGHQNLHVDFTPDDPTTYNGASADVQINVLPAVTTTTTVLTSAPSSPLVGESVTFTATVTATSGTVPTGAVTFKDGTTLLDTVALSSSGLATLTTSSLAAGSHSITATYSGDPNFQGSSQTITIAVLIPAKVRIEPEVINLASKGAFIAIIELPKGYSGADVDKSSVQCSGAVAKRVVTNKGCGKAIIAIFKISDLKGISPGDKVTLTVTGKLKENLRFKGTDTVRVIKKTGCGTKDEILDWTTPKDADMFARFYHGG
jgi:outer membrane protein assembly factor BamB